MKKMPSAIHSHPLFAELRKNNQGVNATKKGSIEKSKRRHEAKMNALKKAKS